MTDHSDFHTMPRMDRRAFLAALAASAAAAGVTVPGVIESRAASGPDYVIYSEDWDISFFIRQELARMKANPVGNTEVTE